MLLCSLSKPSYRPAGERVVCVCVWCVRGCSETAEGSGIIECSLVPGEGEVVTLQSLQP